jgi:hypothetical protein
MRATQALALAGALAISAPAFAAKPPPQYVQFSGAAKGALYRPDPLLFPSPRVGVVVMHRNSNYLSHISTRELTDRGFVVLGMNPRCDNNEAACAPWENNALDVRSGVTYLRTTVGMPKVVLLGHSGGGPTMSFYQAVAEKGAAFCQQAQKLIKCGNGHNGLPKADGVILMDAHPGNGINAVRSIHPGVTNDSAVINQNRKPSVNPTLDPFSERNGYDITGNTRFSEEFKGRVFRAQAARMNFLIDQALAKLADAEAAGDNDAAFIVPLADNARMADIDLSIHHSTVLPRRLVKNDGTYVDTLPVESVRTAGLEPGDELGFGATMFLTLRSFLSVRAVRSTDSMDGIEWCSSNNSTNCNLQQVSVPLLVTAMGGHYFIRDSEAFFDMAASLDKQFLVIEGATHGGTPCTTCKPNPGPTQYNNATKNLFDQMRNWMNVRF